MDILSPTLPAPILASFTQFLCLVHLLVSLHIVFCSSGESEWYLLTSVSFNNNAPAEKRGSPNIFHGFFFTFLLEMEMEACVHEVNETNVFHTVCLRWVII